MQTIKEKIQIVEYEERFAKSIAKMWNESRDSWGGDTNVMTEEQVLKKERNSEDIILYLALQGEKVVGYCGISEYKEDVDALYIRLLNVHPDYHGQKIGKQLVLKAVDKTVELGWPRIDLYTWPGNTKAVPLYKKCGFFWEDRDDTTHLMNFIPMVLQNEFTKSIFQQLDWYKDNVRAIEVKPDGFKENGFTFYEYVWKKNDTYLRVQIERSGRGIRLIETNDFCMEVKLNQHTQIEGRRSTLNVIINNKGNQFVDIQLEGLKSDRVHVVDKVKDTVLTTKTFLLPLDIKLGEEPNEWITHPSAKVKVLINGLETILSIGMHPKKAIKVKAVFHPSIYQSKQVQYCYLELENHLHQDAHIRIQLEKNPMVEWCDSEQSILLSDRGMIKIPFQILKYGFLQSNCLITVQSGNEQYEWKETIGLSLPNFGVKSGGYDQDYYYLQNGYYKVIVRKRDNAVSFGNEPKFGQRTLLFNPKFGKPYVSELAKKSASSFEWTKDEGSATMRVHYELSKPQPMKLSLCFELYGEGVIKYWMEMENTSDTEIAELFVYQPIYHEINKTYIPLNKQIIYFDDSKRTDYAHLNNQKLSENWIFSNDQIEPHGITWSNKLKASFEDWYLYTEEEIKSFQPTQQKQTSPIHFSVGAIKTVNDFQMYAASHQTNQVSSEISLQTLSSNPIVNGDREMILSLNRSQNRSFDGHLIIKENETTRMEMGIQQKSNKELQFQYKTETKTFIPLNYQLKSKSQSTTGSLLLLKQNQTMIDKKKFDESNHEIFEIQNGDLRFRAAPSFFPTLYSLKFQEKEWFDTSFPKPEPKAWWNPWAGGMRSYLEGMSLFSFLKEQSTAKFAKKLDCFGNEWEGIAIETKVENHEKWKGLSIVQYYLTIPGIPIFAHFSEMVHPNRYISHHFHTEMWLKRNTLKDTTVHFQDVYGTKRLHAGYEEHLFRTSNPYYFTDAESSQILQVLYGYKPLDPECLFSEEVAQAYTLRFVKAEPESHYTTEPLFIMFPNQPFEKEMIQNLKLIRF